MPLIVVGPSGSGKSSLLRAGLIPSLPDRPARRLALFTPGATPLRELARQLAGLDRDTLDPADQEAAAQSSRIEAALRSDPRTPAGPGSSRTAGTRTAVTLGC